MSGLFGTDGVRGEANRGVMTAETAMKLAMAAGRYFTRGTHRHRVVIGKDPRLSGYMIEGAMEAGFTSVGMEVLLTGPIPTPGIGMLTRSMRADIGVMISASHNPYTDNGVKFFGPDGYKLSDEDELAIEALMDTPRLAAATDIGRAIQIEDAVGRYIEIAKASFPKTLSLDGLKIVVDCANGAAYKTAPTVLWELGAEVLPLAVSPDGRNINRNCGSTYPKTCADWVVANGADIGVALDGDADRVILIDETGRVVDGDQIIGLIADAWRADGRLVGGGVVTTVMSNIGLERMLEGVGLNLFRTPVGDRNVVAEMRARGLNVGGEQSGHVVLSDYATTGDGLIAALQVMAAMQARGRPASEVCAMFTAMPQILENIRFDASNGDPLEAVSVRAAIRESEARLVGSGRLLIRKSGTEPLIRVMAEGDDEALIRSVVAAIAAEVAAA
ncbi:phosphoglucosamine mutase [Pikeienuella sp. HZG-20]|uniref:phosphoglucosamine mutase n=1 Tax=Paludibacillus litoralis TaxID=3133267 RepID=UPI0030ED9003